MASPTLLWTDALILVVMQCDWVHGRIEGLCWGTREGQGRQLLSLLLARQPVQWKLKDGRTGERFTCAGYVERCCAAPCPGTAARPSYHVTVAMDGPLLEDEPGATPVQGVNVRGPMAWEADVVARRQAQEG